MTSCMVKAAPSFFRAVTSSEQALVVHVQAETPGRHFVLGTACRELGHDIPGYREEAKPYRGSIIQLKPYPVSHPQKDLTQKSQCQLLPRAEMRGGPVWPQKGWKSPVSNQQCCSPRFAGQPVPSLGLHRMRLSFSISEFGLQ